MLVQSRHGSPSSHRWPSSGSARLSPGVGSGSSIRYPSGSRSENAVDGPTRSVGTAYANRSSPRRSPPEDNGS